MKNIIYFMYFLHTVLSVQQSTAPLFLVNSYNQNVKEHNPQHQAGLVHSKNWSHSPRHPLHSYLNPYIMSNHSYDSVLIHARRELILRQRFHQEDRKFDAIDLFIQKLRRKINAAKTKVLITVEDKKDNFTRTFSKLRKFLSKGERNLYQVDDDIQRIEKTLQMHDLNFQQDMKEINKGIKDYQKEIMEQVKEIGIAGGAIGQLGINYFGTQDLSQLVIGSVGKRQFDVKIDENSGEKTPGVGATGGGFIDGLTEGLGFHSTNLDDMLQNALDGLPQIKNISKISSTSRDESADSVLSPGERIKPKKLDVSTSTSTPIWENFTENEEAYNNTATSTFALQTDNSTENGTTHFRNSTYAPHQTNNITSEQEDISASTISPENQRDFVEDGITNVTISSEDTVEAKNGTASANEETNL